MHITAIIIAIYVAAFFATTVTTIVNYKPNADGNIPLTILAHVFWPAILLAFFIWVSVEMRGD
jgi:hypothetical protein